MSKAKSQQPFRLNPHRVFLMPPVSHPLILCVNTLEVLHRSSFTLMPSSNFCRLRSSKWIIASRCRQAVGLSFELSSFSWNSVSKRSLFLVLLERLSCFLLSCFSKAAWQMSVYYSPISRVFSHQSCVVLFFFSASGYFMGWSPLQVLCSLSFLQDRLASCASVEAFNVHKLLSLAYRSFSTRTYSEEA